MCLAIVWLCYFEQDKEVQEFGEVHSQKKAKMNDKLESGAGSDCTTLTHTQTHCNV